jgi:hypothetical protein
MTQQQLFEVNYNIAEAHYKLKDFKSAEEYMANCDRLSRKHSKDGLKVLILRLNVISTKIDGNTIKIESLFKEAMALAKSLN